MHPNFLNKDTNYFRLKADGVRKTSLDVCGTYNHPNLAEVDASYLVKLRIARAIKPRTIILKMKSSPIPILSTQLDESTNVENCSTLLVYTNYIHDSDYKDEFFFCILPETSLLLLFPKAYLCETGFSRLLFIKSKYRSRLDAEDGLRCALAKTIPIIADLVKQKQDKPSH
ncbi:hypothetical protein RF11_10447 [Thelohanellus kitauei]|uniref:Uncharacterized protein n=1 Tax=Thelohanellus kitauei TaxID=669202 RepID=A0A0C2JZR9_THEKT|nr:hypothetical protein RF11_10447 [Thelohanellus kitauei]